MIFASAYPPIVACVLIQAFCVADVNVAAAATSTVSFPSSSPSNAANVPPNFVGFGFDGLFLNTYNNDFSANLINSVANRMSAPPVIRIGGTSSDRMTYDPAQKNAAKCLRHAPHGDVCPWGSGASSIVGPSYFDGFKAFPNCHMSFQVALGASPNFTNAVQFAKQAYGALGKQRTVSIALGNEVESYDADGGSPSAYINDALKMENEIIAGLSLDSGQTRIFEVLDLGSASMDRIRNNNHNTWSIAQAFEARLDKNGNVNSAAAHWYQIDGSQGPKTLQGLMNHAGTIRKGQPYIDAIKYLRANHSHVPFVLTETAAVIGNAGNPEYAPTFGACLWSVDWQMYSMSQRVARIAATQRPQAHHSLWIPVANVTGSGTDVPEVRAPYYAQHFIADFIGKSQATTAVTEMDLKDDHLTAYAAYEDGQLARIALVNLNEWTSTNGPRHKQHFLVPVPSGVGDVRLARLAAEDGAYAGGYDFDKRNITYAGQQWSKDIDNGKGHPDTQSFEKLTAHGGKLTVTLAASEALIIHLH